MTAIKLPNTYTEDERWLDVGAYGFALHVAACCYVDRRDKDGLFPKNMAARVALMVPPEEVEDAVQALVKAGFWAPAGTSWRLVNYLEDGIGLSAEEKLTTRKKWSDDKRWRRRHGNGIHDQCPPDKCRVAADLSQVDTTADTGTDTVGDSSNRTLHDSTLLDTTRLDPNPGGVRGEGERRARGGKPRLNRPSGPASAGATASPPGRALPNGNMVTAEWLGQDPHALSEEEFIQAVMGVQREFDRALGIRDAS